MSLIREFWKEQDNLAIFKWKIEFMIIIQVNKILNKDKCLRYHKDNKSILVIEFKIEDLRK